MLTKRGWLPGRQGMTAEQCKAGRLLARWSIADLAGRSGVEPLTVQAFEEGEESWQAGQLYEAFTEHGLELHDDGRWSLEGVYFNPCHDLRPHVGRDCCEPLSGLEWPRSDDLPASLWERPVPVPWWAAPRVLVSLPDGERTESPAPGPQTDGLTEIEREWVRRNPEAVERWLEQRRCRSR